MAFEILFILLLIIANGIFSGSEIAVVSARKLRLQQLAEKGSRPARAALRLAESPNDFLSTVQIGITLIGILSGAVAGATVAQQLRPIFDGIEALQPYSEGLTVTLVVALITYLSLVIGELVPKRIALANPERIACRIAPAMRTLSKMSAPAVHLLGISTDAVLRLLNVDPSAEPDITEEEIKALIRQGADSGVFEESEHDMVQRVLRLGDRTIKTMMTPRTEIRWLDLESSLEENLTEVKESNHSRFPVGRGSLDDCIGIVRVRSLLNAHLGNDPIDLEALCQPPLYVAESIRCLTVLEQFKRTGIHIALVTDEFGGVEGLVTLNDLMEGIVGDLPALEDEEGPSFVTRDDGSWLVDGSLDINDFDDRIGSKLLGSDEQRQYHTMAGFVIHALERIPKASDNFNWQGYRFEVMDMDGKRVDKILVTPPVVK
ncbi:HlyC/CorC family transporter [Synechococcus sp. Cruz-9H2]|uniref:hemolysin family protein n=1 Tax=unclassified Synechococcus TaxID=2626047 RepID=UPI0020CFBBC0|nr:MULTISPECIES: hemolysin family protein [unclassified Synechococcus]MCP9818291.1 HlyC/CorC family transporter [Synechococcus sp. Cruz-9H2]MCP9842209.1 HlyC/CorC family transporter [Synechococcus sp. Edmonson 11F2]MCP9854687.1 HlyC/CorC family transporter [Synechococcus sp. Cruz-9C9]MCP9861617.1 HlyC/CorC family transporter [Synechococcus sp. Cruz-7E5]MCP9869199.1 HlyC/CorC family transporter [Synechococcus sp. Cruz-7B9]